MREFRQNRHIRPLEQGTRVNYRQHIAERDDRSAPLNAGQRIIEQCTGCPSGWYPVSYISQGGVVVREERRNYLVDTNTKHYAHGIRVQYRELLTVHVKLGLLGISKSNNMAGHTSFLGVIVLLLPSVFGQANTTFVNYTTQSQPDLNQQTLEHLPYSFPDCENGTRTLCATHRQIFRLAQSLSSHSLPSKS